MSSAELTIQLNGVPQQVPAGLTIAGLIERLALQQRRIAVELNGTIVPRTLHAQQTVQAGDQIEVVTAIGGG
ncbi:MAG TPA: sulfur carrier protein ThiS [Pseudomonadales bacterium]|nr:sulfur carrier protein ThiS [Pseudomonadales bacterium]HMW14938.1 sulfur carrier protein ThiS [Pseudomonadales bacterium]HMW83269.1 sulfur carrier protein ThiS [Pseudomonadales bacterium]HMY96586.1 sulfur carrier protein ThiS [Pseudomonadales bacterium]HMZ70806.1 sulfur carrier protein ThiS [Pseudomonadales bacterium]